MDDKELLRYVDYLQNQLSSSSEKIFVANEREWFVSNRADISEKFKNLSKSNDSKAQDIANRVLEYSFKTKNDSFFSNEIFDPIIQDVLDICKDAGFVTKASVLFANSPELSPSPFARPSVHGHILFAGRGTFSFCNYWSKIFTTLWKKISLANIIDPSFEEVKEFLKKDNQDLDILRLVIHYSFIDTVSGFGRLNQDKELHSVRAQLANAMEVFIIAHEIGHFVHEEDNPSTNGIPPDSSEKDVEIVCDSIALVVSSSYGKEKECPFSFQFLAPLIFFHSLRICENSRSELRDIPEKKSQSHPTLNERIAWIKEFSKKASVSDHVLESIYFTIKICEFVEQHVKEEIYKLKLILDKA